MESQGKRKSAYSFSRAPQGRLVGRGRSVRTRDLRLGQGSADQLASFVGRMGSRRGYAPASMCEDVLVRQAYISQSGAALTPTSDPQQNPLQPGNFV